MASGEFEINPMPPQIDAALLALASEVEPATIGHILFRGFCQPVIRPMIPQVGRIVGTAVTLALPALDSTLLHYAADLVREGDILLVDRLGDERYACFGGGVALAMKAARLTGAIIDGPCADPAELREIGLPIWSTGISAITTRILGIGGAMNVPVNIGGAVVMPGDVIIADEGGIVALPLSIARSVIQRALEMQEKVATLPVALATGKTLGQLSGASAIVQAALSNSWASDT